MRRLVLACVLTAGWSLTLAQNAPASPDATPTPVPSIAPSAPKGHKASEAVKKELTVIVEAQLAAFRANEYNKAFSFASTDLQAMFAPEEFEKMVKTAYPVIAKSASAEFGMAFDTGEEAVMNVRVQDAGKKSVEYHYLFKKEGETWKISGVTEIKAEGLSV